MMLLRLATALRNAWAIFEQFAEAIDGSPYEDFQLYCRDLEGRIAQLVLRIGCRERESLGSLRDDQGPLDRNLTKR